MPTTLLLAPLDFRALGLMVMFDIFVIEVPLHTFSPDLAKPTFH